jgi:response regulator of citrate/malate metabolism
MTDNFSLILRIEGLKDLLVKSFKLSNKWQKRLYQYRSSKNASQEEADRRQKELDTFKITIEQAILVVQACEKEIIRLSVNAQQAKEEAQKAKKYAQEFADAYQKNIDENIMLTELLLRKNQKPIC